VVDDADRLHRGGRSRTDLVIVEESVRGHLMVWIDA